MPAPRSATAIDRHGFPPEPLTRPLLAAALAEDLPGGIDLTSMGLFDAQATGAGTFLVKAEGVIAGLAMIERVYRELGATVEVHCLIEDGDPVKTGTVAATVRGPLRALLIGERTILNLMQRLSGVASLTAKYVAAVAGTACKIADTRKTTPGLRALEKYAVRVGGGSNHRMSLSDGAMVKDNHLAALGVQPVMALTRLRAWLPHTTRLEVEVTRMDQAEAAVYAGADILLLDNMSPADMRAVVERFKGKVVLEASGGITLETIKAVAATGVDLISVGALTHSIKALDISFELDSRP